MAVTIKDIAAMAGVSRGTVDRALHGRGRVDPATRDRILTLAHQMNYRPSRAAKQLAIQKQKLTFGIICRKDNQGFWSEMLMGVDDISKELAEYGITILRHHFDDFLPEVQVSLIDQMMKSGVTGLVIVPLNHDKVRDKLKEAMAAGITVVVVNSEIEGVEPLCYIGNDYRTSGRTAAGLMHLFSRGERLNLAVLEGTRFMMSHQQRIEGFMKELDALGTDYTLTGGFEITADSSFAYRRSMELFENYPEINAIFTVAGSVPSVCQAIRDSNLTHKVRHISFDLTPTTRPCLLDGTLTAAIGQEAHRQGYLPFKILFDFIVSKMAPETKHIVTHNEIFIRQNCE